MSYPQELAQLQHDLQVAEQNYKVACKVYRELHTDVKFVLPGPYAYSGQCTNSVGERREQAALRLADARKQLNDYKITNGIFFTKRAL